MSVTPTCPICDGHTTVLTSRKAVTEPNAMRRRRQCDDCAHTFSTLEQPEEAVIAECFIIEAYDEQGTPWPTTMTNDVARIGGELERITGRRHHPATIHHWQLCRAINGSEVDWKKVGVFKWPE
jgi:hypothetical protein